MTTPARSRAHLRPKIPHEKPKFVQYYRKNRGWGPFAHYIEDGHSDDVSCAGALFTATENLDKEAVKMAQILKRMSYVQRKRMRRMILKEIANG